MAISEEIQIVDLTTTDIEAGLALSDEAGWNQTGEDWRIFIESGRTIGVRDVNGRLVASAAALPYENRFGYIGMVLVTETWQRRGIATRLVDRCIESLRDSGHVPMLDATPAGELVYRRQGFHTLFSLDRWECNSLVTPHPETTATIAVRSDLDRIIDIDAMAIGSGRRQLIEGFFKRSGTQVFLGADGESLAMIRDGRKARQIGPVIARSQSLALDLLGVVLAHCSSRIFIDVLSAWTDIGEWLAQRGFSIQRSFSRMAYGRSKQFGSPDFLFAVAGPEFG